jgi:glycine C-acetyltransferase
LEANTKQFRSLMSKAGFDLGGSRDHPIVPIMLFSARLASNFADEMLKKGINVIGTLPLQPYHSSHPAAPHTCIYSVMPF